MIRVRICTNRCRCHNSCRKSRFSGLGTQICGKLFSSISLRRSRASLRSFFRFLTRLVLISARSPIHSSAHRPPAQNGDPTREAGSTKDEGKLSDARAALPGKALSDIPALKPYWGKPAVRNFREGNGNVGIIRSPLRAIALPDQSCKVLLHFSGNRVYHTLCCGTLNEMPVSNQ